MHVIRYSLIWLWPKHQCNVWIGQAIEGKWQLKAVAGAAGNRGLIVEQIRISLLWAGLQDVANATKEEDIGDC